MKLEMKHPRWSMLLGAALLAPTVLGGCKLGPDYVQPPVPQPETYRQPTPSGESIANVCSRTPCFRT